MRARTHLRARQLERPWLMSARPTTHSPPSETLCGAGGGGAGTHSFCIRCIQRRWPTSAICLPQKKTEGSKTAERHLLLAAVGAEKTDCSQTPHKALKIQALSTKKRDTSQIAQRTLTETWKSQLFEAKKVRVLIDGSQIVHNTFIAI